MVLKLYVTNLVYIKLKSFILLIILLTLYSSVGFAEVKKNATRSPLTFNNEKGNESSSESKSQSGNSYVESIQRSLKTYEVRHYGNHFLLDAELQKGNFKSKNSFLSPEEFIDYSQSTVSNSGFNQDIHTQKTEKFHKDMLKVREELKRVLR